MVHLGQKAWRDDWSRLGCWKLLPSKDFTHLKFRLHVVFLSTISSSVWQQRLDGRIHPEGSSLSWKL